MRETQARSTQPCSDSKRRILIVDDEPSVVNLLAEIVAAGGLQLFGVPEWQRSDALDEHPAI